MSVLKYGLKSVNFVVVVVVVPSPPLKLQPWSVLAFTGSVQVSVV